MSGSRSLAETPPDPELKRYLDELLGVSAEAGAAGGSGAEEPAHRGAVAGPSSTDPEPLPPGCPGWLASGFSIEIFQLAKLRFAVPSCQVHEARRIEQTLTPAPGGGRILGRLQAAGHTWSVVDTARLILPDTGSKFSYRWMLPVSGCRVALACEGVSETKAIQACQVRWRRQRQSRPWLLGMLDGDRPCALIDVNALVADLKSDQTEVKHGGSCGKNQ